MSDREKLDLRGTVETGGGGPEASDPASATSPCVNRRLGITACKLTGEEAGTLTAVLDWLNLQVPAEVMGLVQRLVSRHLGRADDGGPRWVEPRHDHSVKWATGALLAWSRGKPNAFLSLNGDSLAVIPPRRQLQMLRKLWDLGARATRLDAALDDWAGNFLTMERIHAAAEAAQVGGFKITQPFQQMNLRNGELLGDGRAFGKRGGQSVYVRAYNKLLESKGAHKSIRLEVELHGDRAERAFMCVASTSQWRRFGGKLGRLVTGSITFADTTGSHGHRDRWRVLDWWQRVLDLVGRTLLVRQGKPKASLVRWARHVTGTASGTGRRLAAMARCFDVAGLPGRDLVHEWIDRQMERDAGLWREPDRREARRLAPSLLESMGLACCWPRVDDRTQLEREVVEVSADLVRRDLDSLLATF